jgi:phosphonate transport system substrate-binding protein
MAVSPEAILEGVRPFAKYLTKKLGVEVKCELVPDYNAMITGLNNGKIQLGYVSNLDYLKIKSKMDITPFAKVIKGGSSTYKSILLVRKDSNINDIKGLKGKRFVYTSKNSSHGYLFPALLIKNKFNQPLEKFFSSISITKKDPDGIFSVLYKRSDAVGASSQTFAILSELMPRLNRELKVIATSEPYVHGPIYYYSKNFNNKTQIEKVKKEILSMEKEPEGKEVLLLFKIGGWTQATDSDYNTLRSMVKRL